MGNSKNRRGWSLVFEDQTSPTAEDPAEVLDQQTVIDDGTLGAELAAALEDPRLKNVAVTTPPGPLDPNGERTVRAPAPKFLSGSSGAEHSKTDPPERPSGMLLAPELPGDADTAPYSGAALGSLMMTRPDTLHEPVRPDPILDEGTLPPTSGPVLLPPPPPAPAPPSVGRGANLGKVAGPAVFERGAEEVEKTDLDIAAALGMAPIPAAGPAPTPVVLPAPPSIAEPKLADVLKEVAEEKKAKRKVGAPREGVGGEDLHRVAATTDSLARIIPVLLMVGLLLGAIAVGVRMLRRNDTQQATHVELRFLPLGRGAGNVVRPAEAPTRFAIETTPPDLLVLYRGEVLGRTPFVVDLPLTLSGPAVAEVSSPYYEAWVGELQPESGGDYKISAVLRPR